MKYFVGIEVAQSEQGIFISQRKYTLDIKEMGLENCERINISMDPNQKFKVDLGVKSRWLLGWWKNSFISIL